MAGPEVNFRSKSRKDPEFFLRSPFLNVAPQRETWAGAVTGPHPEPTFIFTSKGEPGAWAEGMVRTRWRAWGSRSGGGTPLHDKRMSQFSDKEIDGCVG